MREPPITRIRRSRRRHGLLLLLDIDGTLAPIAPTPEAARVPRRTLRAIERLRDRSDTKIGLISGRPLEEIDRLVPVSGLAIVGVHGFVRRSPGRRQEVLWNAALLARARRLALRLKTLERSFPGVLIERKGANVVLHTRKVDRARRREVESLASERVPKGFETLSGRCVLEFRPKNAPTKGDAVKWFRRLHPKAVILYAGDDVTDEEAFAELRKEDFGILVGGADRDRGKKIATRARYFLSGPQALGKMLEILAAEDQ